MNQILVHFFLSDNQKNPSFKNQFDYGIAHTHSSCYLATNKALLVIAVQLSAAKEMDKGCSAIT